MSVHHYVADLERADQVAFAAAYPFAQVARSYVFADGRAVPLTAFATDAFPDASGIWDGQERALRDVLDPVRIAALGEPRVPVIAVGSNASPEQLLRKYGTGEDVIPTLRGHLEDHCIAFAAHITAYGSLPASLHHHPGARVQVFVNYLTHRQLEAMHGTEVLGYHYTHTEFDALDLTLENGERVASASAYIAARGLLARDNAVIRLAEVPHPREADPAFRQREALEYVRRALEPETAFDDFVHAHIIDRDVRYTREQDMLALSIPTRTHPSGRET